MNDSTALDVYQHSLDIWSATVIRKTQVYAYGLLLREWLAPWQIRSLPCLRIDFLFKDTPLYTHLPRTIHTQVSFSVSPRLFCISFIILTSRMKFTNAHCEALSDSLLLYSDHYCLPEGITAIPSRSFLLSCKAWLVQYSFLCYLSASRGCSYTKYPCNHRTSPVLLSFIIVLVLMHNHTLWVDSEGSAIFVVELSMASSTDHLDTILFSMDRTKVIFDELPSLLHRSSGYSNQTIRQVRILCSLRTSKPRIGRIHCLSSTHAFCRDVFELLRSCTCS